MSEWSGLKKTSKEYIYNKRIPLKDGDTIILEDGSRAIVKGKITYQRVEYNKSYDKIIPFLSSIEGTYAKTHQRLVLGNLTFYFYDNIVIAFEDEGHLYIMQNEGRNTGTGGALNHVDKDKKKRIPVDDFLRSLTEVLFKYGLSSKGDLVEKLL